MKVVTVNLLRDGRVAYLGVDEEWSVYLDGAKHFLDQQADDALLQVQKRTDEVADAYLIDVEDKAPSGRTRLRETIRSAGPTVREDLGKQAEHH